jgi:hypothetical protein
MKQDKDLILATRVIVLFSIRFSKQVVVKRGKQTMPGEEQKEAQKFYKNLRLKGSKHQFKNALGVQIKCFGIAFPNGHDELHERDIIVGLVEMIGPEPSFEDLVERLGLEAFEKVDAVYGFAEPFEDVWKETIGTEK